MKTIYSLQRLVRTTPAKWDK